MCETSLSTEIAHESIYEAIQKGCTSRERLTVLLVLCLKQPPSSSGDSIVLLFADTFYCTSAISIAFSRGRTLQSTGALLRLHFLTLKAR